MKSHFFTRNFVFILILFSIVMSCQKDQSQLVENSKTISLEDVKELYSKQKVFSKINPKDNLPIQWEPLWDEAITKKTNDSTEYMFIPLHPYLKSDRKQKSDERGAKTYLLVKNGGEFYSGIYYGNSKEEIVDIRTFTGKMLFTNLEKGSSNLINYRNGSPYFDESVNIKKKGASSTKMGWEQNCRTEIKDCSFRLLDYSCMGQLIVVRSMDCTYPGFCTQYYWDLIDSNEVTTCYNVWVPDAPDGGGGGGYTPSEEDKEIIDSLQGYPCAQAILADIPNLENEISAWLNAVFSNNTDFNITFSDAPKLVGTKTDAEHNSFGSIHGQTHKILINPDILKNASKEYIAATMFHEVLHGFLNYERTRLINENKAEQFGILYSGWTAINVNGQQRFVKKHDSFGTQLDKLKKAIQSFNPNLSEYDALALAKNGIVTGLDPVESSVNANHRSGKAGTTCK